MVTCYLHRACKLNLHRACKLDTHSGLDLNTADAAESRRPHCKQVGWRAPHGTPSTIKDSLAAA
jgi:hypothetical protein